MEAIVKEALEAGALGFHLQIILPQTTNPLPSVGRKRYELLSTRWARPVRIFEIAGESPGRDPERIREYHIRLRDTVESGVTQTWGMLGRVSLRIIGGLHDLLDETAELGGRMFAQVHSRALGLLSLRAILHTIPTRWRIFGPSLGRTSEARFSH